MPLLHILTQKMLAQDAVFSYKMRKVAEFKKDEYGKLGGIILMSVIFKKSLASVFILEYYNEDI